MNMVVKLQDIKSTHRNLLHSYTLTMRKQKEKWRKQFHSPLQRKVKYLGIYLPKETKDLLLLQVWELSSQSHQIYFWSPSLSFPSLIAVAKTSKTMLNSSGESGHPCLVPDFRGNAFNYSPLRLMFAMGL